MSRQHQVNWSGYQRHSKQLLKGAWKRASTHANFMQDDVAQRPSTSLLTRLMRARAL